MVVAGLYPPVIVGVWVLVVTVVIAYRVSLKFTLGFMKLPQI